MRLVSENLLSRITRKQYSTIHGKLFELWDRYKDGEISTSKQAAEGLQCHHGTRPYCLLALLALRLLIMWTNNILPHENWLCHKCKFETSMKNIYTCRWLRSDEPLWTNWLHILYNVNWSCDVALNAKQCHRQINNLIRIFFLQICNSLWIMRFVIMLWEFSYTVNHVILLSYTRVHFRKSLLIYIYFNICCFTNRTPSSVFRQYLKSIKCSWYA